MLSFHRGHRHPATPPARAREIEDSGSDPCVPDSGVGVLLSPGVMEMAPALSRELGPGFCVVTDGPGVTGVMIVGPLGAAAMAFLRASHPGVVLLVVDRRWHVPRPDEAVIHLEAGADGYLACPPVAEVASHVRALARRGRSASVIATGSAIPTRSPVSAP